LIELTGTITNISPLHIGTGKKTGTFSKTLEYIPGRTIRGMVGYYLYNNNRKLFDDLKISEDSDMQKTRVFFKEAHPMFENSNSISSPLSLMWCKKCESLMQQDADECSAEIVGKKCLHEGKKIPGFITKNSITLKKLQKLKVTTQIETKCPIIRNGHTSPGSDYALSPYHIESIQPGTDFAFRCILEESYIADFKAALKKAGVFSGLGGYRSRGYGTVAIKNFKENQVNEIINKREREIANLSSTVIVANSPIILRLAENSVIGFDTVFSEYASKTSAYAGYDLSLQLSDKYQRISEAFAGGWSIKYGNRVSEIIPCIGHGSCAMISANDSKALASLEVYGVGEMTNSGYGDVYIMEGDL